MILVYRVTAASTTTAVIYCPPELNSLGAKIPECFEYFRSVRRLTPWFLLLRTDENSIQWLERADLPRFHIGVWIKPEDFFRTEFKDSVKAPYFLTTEGKRKAVTPLDRTWEALPALLIQELIKFWRTLDAPSQLYLLFFQEEVKRRWPNGFKQPQEAAPRFDREELI